MNRASADPGNLVSVLRPKVLCQNLANGKIYLALRNPGLFSGQMQYFTVSQLLLRTRL
jgi:hypothetical protein